MTHQEEVTDEVKRSLTTTTKVGDRCGTVLPVSIYDHDYDTAMRRYRYTTEGTVTSCTEDAAACDSTTSHKASKPAAKDMAAAVPVPVAQRGEATMKLQVIDGDVVRCRNPHEMSDWHAISHSFTVGARGAKTIIDVPTAPPPVPFQREMAQWLPCIPPPSGFFIGALGYPCFENETVVATACRTGELFGRFYDEYGREWMLINDYLVFQRWRGVDHFMGRQLGPDSDRWESLNDEERVRFASLAETRKLLLMTRDHPLGVPVPPVVATLIA